MSQTLLAFLFGFAENLSAMRSIFGTHKQLDIPFKVSLASAQRTHKATLRAAKLASIRGYLAAHNNACVENKRHQKSIIECEEPSNAVMTRDAVPQKKRNAWLLACVPLHTFINDQS